MGPHRRPAKAWVIGYIVGFLLGAGLLLALIRVAEQASKGSARAVAKPLSQTPLAANARTLVNVLKYLLEPETGRPVGTNVVHG